MSRRGQVKTEVDSAAQVKEEVDSLTIAPSTKGKRGRKKKDAEVESGGKMEDGAAMKQELITDHMPVVKKKRKIDRFNGMPEEEVVLRLLPDRLAHNLDILIIGINPGLFAAYIGHHYAGPGNHFWKCLYLSGLVPEPMNCYDDIKLQQFGIGFTNMCARTTRGSADLKKKEIEEGGQILREKLKEYKPKIAVFNGKGIYEVFSGSKKFTFGKQPGLIEGTETISYVMPSSSARCAQLPRAIDKVPFYEALGRLRDYVVGRIPHLDESTVTFPTLELKNVVKKEEPSPNAENQDSGGGEGDATSQSNSGPLPAIKKEKTTRARGKGRGKKQGDAQEQSNKDGAASSECQPVMTQAYCQEQPTTHRQENRPTTNEANHGQQNRSQVSIPSQLFYHHALTSPVHHAVGMTPGTNGVLNPSMVDFTSLRPADNNSSPHPTFLSGFSTPASQDFMSGFYAGSQPFGMVGFPNAVASQQPNGAMATGDWSEKGPVKIKSEPVDLDSQH